jgi:antitoxin (DNA-binding transcriptional repressor) of toxin-antitoxin stability system
MPIEVNVHEAKTHLSRLVEQALEGEDVVIMKSGKPLVRLTIIHGALPQRKIGSAKGDFAVPLDFDEPLSEEILAEFEK